MAKLLPQQIFPSTSGIKSVEIRGIEDVQQLQKEVSGWADRVTHFLDTLIKKITAIPFNKSESLEVADTGTANTEFSVTHHLIRVPEGFIITNTDKAGIVFDSGTAWTKTTIHLKCSVASASIKLSVF